MSVYFGRLIQKANTVGISGTTIPGTERLRAKPSECRVHAYYHGDMATATQIYPNMVQIYASQKETAGIIINSPTPLYTMLDDMIMDFGLPDLCVSWDGNGKIPAGNDSRLSQIGYTTHQFGNKTFYIFKGLTAHDLKAIIAARPKEKGYSPESAVNLVTMKGVVYLLKILKVAFTVSANRDNIRPAFGTYTAYKPCTKGLQASKIFTSQQVQVSGANFDYECKRNSMTWTISGGTPNSTCIPYIPDLFKNTKFLDDTTTIPDNGLVFPYVKALADADPMIVPRFVARYLVNGLSTIKEVRAQHLNEINSSWVTACRTEFGIKVAHYVKCLDLAASACAQLLPICIGRKYYGSVISGASFVIIDHDKVIVPLKKDDLRPFISDLQDHTLVLSAILEIVKAAVTTYTAPTPLPSTMREFGYWLRRQGLDEETQEAVKREASRLNFGEDFWMVNQANLKKGLELMTSSTTIPTTFPLFYACLFSTDRIANVLACFGPRAPSFSVPGGRKVKLTQTPSTHANKNRFLVKIVPLHSAIANFEEVRRLRSVNQYPPNTQMARADKQLTNANRDEIWPYLRKAAGVSDDEEPEKEPSAKPIVASDDAWI